MPLPNVEHPHSGIARELRYRFRELKDLRDIRKFELSAVTSISTSSRRRAEIYKKAFDSIFSTIPYLSVDHKEKERTISNNVELYKQLKTSITKDMAKKEFDSTVAKSRGDVHVLGGTSRKRTVKKVKQTKN